MYQKIKLQTGVIVNIVSILLIFKGIGILRSISSKLDIFAMNNPIDSVRSFLYLILLIIPFFFLVKFLLAMQRSHRNNEVVFLIDAFKELKFYFIALIASQILRLVIDFLHMVGNSLF